MAKYKNIKCGKYDSQKEARRADELHMLQKNGIISELEEQVRYQLVPAQKDDKGKVIERAVCYVADFKYIVTNGNTLVVEDAKGMRTRDYIIKRKLMLHTHKIRIREV